MNFASTRSLPPSMSLSLGEFGNRILKNFIELLAYATLSI
jgi:hypothetical protein